MRSIKYKSCVAYDRQKGKFVFRETLRSTFIGPRTLGMQSQGCAYRQCYSVSINIDRRDKTFT